MYESYKFIHTPTYEHSEGDVMDNAYKSVEELGEKFIVKNEVSYRVYPSLKAFKEDLDSMNIASRAFHEVIFGSKTQKLKFDIDAPMDKIPEVNAVNEDNAPAVPAIVLNDEDIDPQMAEFLKEIESIKIDTEETPIDKCKHMLNEITRTISDVFFITYGIDLQRDNLVICASEDPSGKKFSVHIIINGYAVKGHKQAHEFQSRLNNYLNPAYKTLIDCSVNKSLQNFRIAGCHKTGDERVKKIISNHSFYDSIITNTSGCIILNDLVAPVQTEVKFNVHPDDAKEVLDICSKDGILEHHELHMCKNNMFIFRRLKSSRCEFCERDHDKDNTLLVTIRNDNGIINVFKSCRKFIAENGVTNASIHMGNFISASAPVEVHNETDQQKHERVLASWGDKIIQKAVADVKNNVELFPKRSLFDNLSPVHKHIYRENTLRDFELTPTLCVKAMMKMGKTKALRNYIEKYFNNKLTPNKIVFVSFRQTFSGNIKEIFNDFTLYSDVKGPLIQRKIIVQVESLYRVAVDAEPPDLLVLDECESIFEQFDSGLLRNFTDCFAKFKWLMKYSKHIVAMDANLQNRTYNIFARLRPNFADADAGIIYHCNEHKNATDDKYYVTSNKLKWLGVLYSTVESDERIAVPMSSLSEAKILVRNLERKFPEKSIKLYSSETSMTEKKIHFANVHRYWSQYDVLVYTPTVSAGVSFELEHFHKIFGYFTDQSCPVETCVQMIGRIRNVQEHSFYICLAASGNSLPVTTETIKEHLFNKRENLSRSFDDIGLTPEYGPIGEIKYHYSDYFYVWLENARVKNLSKNSFIKRFVHFISETGAVIDELTEKVFNESTGMSSIVDGCVNQELVIIQEMHAHIKTEIRAELCKNVAESPELEEEEVVDIQNAMMAQQDITDIQKHAYEKYKLRSEYKFYGDIDETFVNIYLSSKNRRIFKNLTRILSHENVKDSLNQIQSEELANYAHNMEMDEKFHHIDVNRKYVFDQHRYAIGLLQMCGWESIKDPKYIHKALLYNQLIDNEKAYWDTMSRACPEFELRKPRVEKLRLLRNDQTKYVAAVIHSINAILEIMYGINIITRRADPDMYLLSENTLFAFDPANLDGRPLIQPHRRKAEDEIFDI
jgi:hypothetical protein